MHLQMTVSGMLLMAIARYDAEMVADTVHVHWKWKFFQIKFGYFKITLQMTDFGDSANRKEIEKRSSQ